MTRQYTGKEGGGGYASGWEVVGMLVAVEGGGGYASGWEVGGYASGCLLLL